MISSINPDYTTLHEPDYINFGQYDNWGKRVAQMKKKISDSGLGNLLYWNLILQTSLVELSDHRFQKKISSDDAVEELIRRRGHFIDSQPGKIYIESSSAYYGLIDVLPNAFANHKVIFIVRNGRDWVQSKMNFGNMYQKGKLRSLVSHTWPRAADIIDDPYRSSWESMSRFDRICWSWRTLNEYAINTIKSNPDARMIRFEDIFISPGRIYNIRDLLDFLFSFPGVDQIENMSKYINYFDNKIHASTKRFPAWEEWPEVQKSSFIEICGPLMESLNY